MTADGDTGLLVTVSTSGPGSTLATEVLGRPSRAHPAVATLEWSGVVSRPSLALACVHCASHSYHTHTDTTAISSSQLVIFFMTFILRFQTIRFYIYSSSQPDVLDTL